MGGSEGQGRAGEVERAQDAGRRCRGRGGGTPGVQEPAGFTRNS